MNKQPSRNKSTGLKLFSLFMAILLWFYVANQGGLTSGKNLVQAELQYYNVPAGLTVVGPPTVAVKLWGAFRETGDIVAYVDLAGLDRGVHNVVVKVKPVKGAMLATVQPDKVKIVLEELEEHILSIKTEVKQNPPSGFELREVKLSPEKCLVRGERAVVSKVVTIVAPLNLADSKGISSLNTVLEARDAEGNVISEGINLLPETIKAYVVVDNKKEVKKVSVKPQFKGRLADGLKLGEISTDPLEISLLGEKNRLDNLNEIVTREIDLSDKKESFSQPIELVIPEGISASSLQVNIQVTIEKISDKVVQ